MEETVAGVKLSNSQHSAASHFKETDAGLARQGELVIYAVKQPTGRVGGKLSKNPHGLASY